MSSSVKKIVRRSIIGSKVCARGDDGYYYGAYIHAVKTMQESNSTHTRYALRFEPVYKDSPPQKRDYLASELIGPGFEKLSNAKEPLLEGQKVYTTHNGRQLCGCVLKHDMNADEVLITIAPTLLQGTLETIKRPLREVHLMPSRYVPSDIGDEVVEMKRALSSTVDIPGTIPGSRKRRTTSSEEFPDDLDHMNECTAALVLLSLSSGSPGSSFSSSGGWIDRTQLTSPSGTLSDCSNSWRSATPSPPLSENSSPWGSIGTDEGIGLETEEDPYDHMRLKPGNRYLFQCTWPECKVITTTCESIETHVRTSHLGPRKRVLGENGCDEEMDDREEEFYYTEVEVEETFSPPTMSHRDMARPPHEDPEYQKTLLAAANSQVSPNTANNYYISIPNQATSTSTPISFTATRIPISPKQLRLSFLSSGVQKPFGAAKKPRGETKKCRKVYGMDHRELWCTQCKWKKACTRFSEG